MKKYVLDLKLLGVEQLREGYGLLRLTDAKAPLPEMSAGQFVEVRVDASAQTFLRRPISINRVDREHNELWLLVHAVGPGTRRLCELAPGSVVNVVLPLGQGFTLPKAAEARGADAPFSLLVGGGVGTAPLLCLGEELVALGHKPLFLLGGRSSSDLMQLDLFRELGEVLLTTEDGTAGERGFVTQHSVWASPSMRNCRFVYTCGPKPMMMAVARLCREQGMECEASLENMMACGLGACLCCVEDTVDGHVCVCKEGPVFDTRRLKWN
ncbi:MAG: dihydroorotate dehydrogenase electron transfer subunit [Bacteroidaceae bacterium]|nr:dihydroorotate dehydrogenase electron transfer subunit [Bacteroidaceae bacterium]